MSLIGRTYVLGTLLTIILVSLAQGTTESTVYTFGAAGSGDGMYPYCTLVADANGNLFGVTQSGGTHGAGIIFELSPIQGGPWIETVLHEFAGGSDGENPMAGLIWDSAGNLYGTAAYGGTNGTGLVFELSPQGEGWTYQILYNFGAYPASGDGFGPNTALIFDQSGNLYGTTSEGGVPGCFEGCGTVFELSPVEGAGWKETLVHEFPADGTDGELPNGVVMVSGALYGTTQNGGTAGSGILYQLKYSRTKKQWIETIIHQFVGGNDDGAFPESAVLYHAGELYGTTEGGGVGSYGTVFRTALSAKAGWPTTVLYSFGPDYSGDGIGPKAGVTMDAKGNIYGTTLYGGAYNYYGTVFRIKKSKEVWVETVLHSFNGEDGFYPGGGVTIFKGFLFGTTSDSSNGDYGGLVYQIKP